MRRRVVLILIGLAGSGPAASATPPQGVVRDTDTFDHLASSFVLRDWITYAREEHERLRSEQRSVNPRFVIDMLNTGSDIPPAVFFVPMFAWQATTSPLPPGSCQLVPDPIQSCVSDDCQTPDLAGMLSFEHTFRRFSSLDLAVDQHK